MKLAIAPVSDPLGSASFYKTWRDTETCEELLCHSQAVQNKKNEVIAEVSCGLDAFARLQDLRLRRNILALEGPVNPVLGIIFSPNGHHLATGGEYNTCRIWDLTNKRCLYIMCAHANLISQIKFDPQYLLVSASYDITANVWSSTDLKPFNVLSGHESQVTSVDVAPDGQSIAIVSYDRTIKLWSTKDVEILER